MTTNNVPETSLERLAKSGPGVEIWWDSSPLVYENWAKKMVSEAPAEKREVLAAQLKRIYDPAEPTKTLFTGVTTNPPLSLAAMQNDPARWEKWIHAYVKQHPGVTVEEVFWGLYREIVRLGAEAFQPLFEASGYSHGYLSGQVDPRCFFEKDKMMRMALEVREMGPNVMIKIPGTKEGIEVVRELTALGIPTNMTAGYVVPQFVAVAEAVQAGLAEARANGVDLTKWRSVVTYMSVRWESAPEFEAQAEQAGFKLTPEDRRWAGIALFKQAIRVYRQRAYPSKMLICSVRMGPQPGHCSHVEETAGADAVFTLPPNFLTDFIKDGEQLNFRPAIWEDIPADVMARLRKVPYFNESYEPDGLTPDQFKTIPSLLATFKEFSGATEKMVTFVRERMP